MDAITTMKRLFTVLALLLGSVSFSYAESADSADSRWLAIPNLATELSDHGFLSYLEDPLNQLTLTYILDHELGFKPYPAESFNQGWTRSAYWLKLPIDASASTHKNWLLEVNYPLLDTLNFVVVDDNGNILNNAPMGDLKPFDDRDFSHRNFVLPLDFSQAAKQVVYIHVRTSSSLQVPIYLWEVNTFVEKRSAEQYGLGFYYGMMLVIFFYNLFLWVVIRDINYLTYIGYVAAFAFLQLATSGLGYQYLWTNSPWIQQVAVPLTIGLVGIFGASFAKGFLQTRVYHRPSDIVLRVCIFLSALVCFGALVLDIETIMTLGQFVVLIFLASIFYASITTLLKGQRQARFFLAAWLSLIVGGTITIGMMMGHFPNNFWTTHASKIGSSLEIILLSFALADRIKILERAKNEAESFAKRQLEDRAERLSESMRLKSDFLSAISHEFRTPMNGILGSLDLASNHTGEQQRAALSDARASANDMLDLVDTVITYTELQAGQRLVMSEIVNVQQLMRDLILHADQQTMNPDLNFKLNIDPDLPSAVRSDSKCLSYALKALLNNAARFTPRGEISLSISLGMLEQQTCLDIWVRDTGLGVPAAELANVQDFFNQLHRAFPAHHRGLGLGLSLIRSICHGMGGRIDFTSTVGKGTDVHLQLPVQLVSDIDTNNSLNTQTSLPVNFRGRALIVEDNTINQRVLQSMLMNMNIQADLADNGEKALELLRTNKESYQIIFMDCQMPVMDGFETTRLIRASDSPSRHCPIIAVTAISMINNEALCKLAGMNDYINKPITREKVESMVRKWLNKLSHPTEASGLRSSSPIQKDV